MIIKPNSILCNNYDLISNLAKEEPIYITKDGEGDLVVMSIDLFERMEEMYKLRSNIYMAEKSRLSGVKTYSLDEIEKELLIIDEEM